MKSRVFSIPFGVFALIMCVCYPIFAQVGGGRASGGSQSIASPPTQALPPSTSTAPDVAPSGSQIQIPFKKNETNTQQSTGQKQGLQGQAQQQTQQQGKQNSDFAENVARLPVAGYVSNPNQHSPVETAFQDLLQTRTPVTGGATIQSLRQFGYAIFGLPVSTFAPIDDVPVGSEYVLGPGDELRVIVWGAMENTYSQTVDHYGRIYLPTVGPIRVWGLTFSQAEKLILSYLSQYYKGFQSSVTMGHLRTIKIYVMGEVNQPGSYNISALSSLTNALVAAGGPSSLGTLRNIQLKRNNQTIEEFDFYDFLLSGDKSKDCRLESGDIIFVPPIGNVVGIAGEVKRPAIYEFKETLRIKDLIAMAGGLTVQSYLNRVQIIRSKPSAEREAIDIDISKAMGKDGISSNVELQNGDLVTIFPSDPRIYNTVSVNGLVKHPGDYEYKPG
ncbi:MAG TPA: SLBB domain-containing protein, partial [Candidatus Brocadiaceae bacterium]|nr:SLBB domain-containing protein [Candidatus Brocadiaceae bacterium]